MKILIADDFERVRKLIKNLLIPHLSKIEFLESSDGEYAIQLNEKYKPQLVLMDIMMGKVDGLTACKKIKEATPETKVIVISQLSEDEYREEALKAGASEYLNKEHLYQLPFLLQKILKSE